MFKIFKVFGALLYFKKNANLTEGIIPNVYISKGDATATYNFSYQKITEKYKFSDSEIKLFELVIEENRDIINSYYSFCLNQLFEQQKNKPRKVGDILEEGTIIEIRDFTEDEIISVEKALIEPSQYGNTVRFVMRGGGVTFIPLLKACRKGVSELINLKTAKLITLQPLGKDKIYRVDDTI